MGRYPQAVDEEREERVYAHQHRVQLEEATMRKRGLDPTKHNERGYETPGNNRRGFRDILHVRAFHSIWKSTDPTEMSPEMRLAYAINATSDDSFDKAFEKNPGLQCQYEAEYKYLRGEYAKRSKDNEEEGPAGEDGLLEDLELDDGR